MTWLRLDDNFADHPKVRNRSDQAYRLFVDLSVYCARYNTDGKLTFAEVEAHRYAEHALELVECGLWEDTDYGFYVPGFLERNPTKEKVEADRAAARERQSRRRSRRDSQGDTRRESRNPDPTRPDPKESGSGSADAEPLPAPETVKANVPHVREIREYLKAVGE